MAVVDGCVAGVAIPQTEPLDEHTVLSEMLIHLDHVPTPEEAKRMLLSSEPRRRLPVNGFAANLVQYLN